MARNSTKAVSLQSEVQTSTHLFEDWFDPIESGVRERVRGFIEGMIEEELEEALARPRYGRHAKDPTAPATTVRTAWRGTGTAIGRGR